jgi:hypothetical protein
VFSIATRSRTTSRPRAAGPSPARGGPIATAGEEESTVATTDTRGEEELRREELDGWGDVSTMAPEIAVAACRPRDGSG